MNMKLLNLFAVLCGVLMASAELFAQCDEGETALDFVIDTDAWGYEMYWELTPAG